MKKCSVIFSIFFLIHCCTNLFAKETTNIKPIVSFEISGKCQTASFSFINNSTFNVDITYLWKFGDGTMSSAYSPTHKYPSKNQTVTYTVWLIATDKITGETDSASKTVTVVEVPKTNASAPSNLCEKDNLVLNVDYILGATWKWEGPANFSSNEQNPVIKKVTTAQSGLYIIEATIDGCTGETDTVEVNITPEPKFDLGKDTTFCNDKSISYTLPAGYDLYIWNDSYFGRDFTPTTTGTYWAEIIDKGCSGYDTVNVTIHKIPTIILKQKAIEICETKKIEISSNVENDVSYRWEGPLGFFSNTAQFQLFDITSAMAGNYVIKAHNNGCYAPFDTVKLAVNLLPKFNLGNDTIHCNDKPLQITAPDGFDTYSWSNGTAGKTIKPTYSGDYRLEVSLKGCTSSDIINVKLILPPNVSLGVDRFICEGQTIKLEYYNQFATYLWQDGSTGSSIMASQPGIYWVEAKVESCRARDSVKLTLQKIPKIELGKDTLLCGIKTVLWNITDDYDYVQWQNYIFSRTFEAYSTGRYTVKVSKNECFGYDTINVTINRYPLMTLGRDISFCAGSTTTLTPESDYDLYKWQDGKTDKQYKTDKPGKYWLEVTQGGCSVTDTINITEIPLPVINLGRDTAICPGDMLILDPKGVFDTYTWFDGSHYNFNTIEKAGTFWVEVMRNSCINRDTIIIKYFDEQSYSIGDDISVCQGNTVDLDAGNGYGSYHWSNGIDRQKITVSKTGRYISYVEDKNGCVLSDTVLVSINENPVITKIDTTHLREIHIIAEKGTQPYKYSLNGGDFGENRKFENLSTGYYKAVVMDANGCISTSRQVYVTAEIISIPNFFTPNGDGTNDFWVIDGLTEYPEAVIKIFDRNGRLLVRLQGNENSWDGTLNGEILPSDTYWYMVYVKPEYEPQTGFVTIKR